ncbi:hypothetical protein [Poriferisphaera sp. WC338]|uniref:hypothetical protein n=1 Tax=Poriferisphaera sp. WC338 TaxID=3425129 RepID=UPI003D8181AB
MAEVNRMYLSKIKTMIHRGDAPDDIIPILRSYQYQGGAKQSLADMLAKIADEELTVQQANTLDQLTQAAPTLWPAL